MSSNAASHTRDAEKIIEESQRNREKARLRLELQHRRKVKQLKNRIEVRKLKQAGVKSVTVLTPAPDAAAATSTKAISRHHSNLSRLIEKEDSLSKSKDYATIMHTKSPVLKEEVGLTERELNQFKLQDRLRDRQIEALKQKQVQRQEKIQESDTRRKTAFGAAGARQMGSASRGYSPKYSDSLKEYEDTTFTMNDFDQLEDDDFDYLLDAAKSQQELTKFDSMYGLGEASATSSKASKPIAELNIATTTSKPKPKINRTSSFVSELDDLLADIM